MQLATKETACETKLTLLANVYSVLVLAEQGKRLALEQ